MSCDSSQLQNKSCWKKWWWTFLIKNKRQKWCRWTRSRFGTKKLRYNPAGWTVRPPLHLLTGTNLFTKTTASRYRHIYKNNSKQVQTYLQRHRQAGAYWYKHNYKVIRELPKGVYKCKYKDKKRKITKCIQTKTIIQRQHKFQKGLEESHSSACSSTTRTHRSRKVREIELWS